MQFPTDSQLECVDLCCVRGDNLLFDKLTFTVNAGDVCQVQGANGAGKTSLLRILCGLALAVHGEVRWRGESIGRGRDAFRASLDYLGHSNGLKGELTPIDNLRAARSLHPSRDDIENEAALDRLGLYGYEDIPCRYLSAGQQRRVAVARLLVGAAQLWILDEPVTALDVDGIAAVQDLLKAHAGAGGMVVITSHQGLSFGSIRTRTIRL